MAMFSFLRRRPDRAEKPATVPTLPPGFRLYAIGDIHGELALAQELVATIEADNRQRAAAEVHLIFLGDYVDRGPDSAGVIEWLANDPPAFATCHFLRGNHEDAFINAIDGAEFDFTGWGKFGGRETLASYGIPEAGFAMGGPSLRSSMRQHIPPEHVDWLRGLADCVRVGDYMFVHAGIKPGVAPEEQDRHDLMWIRREFLDSDADHGVMVVHGHTITREVDVRPNRIGIDTGGYLHGTLTAIGIEGGGHWFMQAVRRQDGSLAA